MQNRFLLIACILVVSIGGGYLLYLQSQIQTASPFVSDTPAQISLSSPAFAALGSIPTAYTCDGGSRVPPLVFGDIPSAARTLVLIAHDPDTEAGDWDHWVVFNIPATTTVVSEGVEPLGIHGRGSAGNRIYSGPCPRTAGVHRFVFSLYALDAALTLPESSTAAEVRVALRGHVLGETELVGTYERPSNSTTR